MATTAEGTRLTEAHRAAQARLAAQLVAVVAARFQQTMGREDARELARQWVESMIPLIAAQHGRSAALSARYYGAFRQAEGITLPFEPPAAPRLNLTAVRTSLYVTGPQELQRKLARGLLAGKAMNDAAAGAAGAAMRHALNGGRRTIGNSLERDRTALAYVRVTREGCCWFCAMLASRGHVYKDYSFDRSDPRFTDGGIPSDVKVHDSCRCTLEPVYHRGSDLPGRAAEFEALWYDVTDRFSGHDKALAFRRAFEEFERSGDREKAIRRGLEGARVA